MSLFFKDHCYENPQGRKATTILTMYKIIDLGYTSFSVWFKNLSKKNEFKKPLQGQLRAKPLITVTSNMQSIQTIIPTLYLK